MSAPRRLRLAVALAVLAAGSAAPAPGQREDRDERPSILDSGSHADLRSLVVLRLDCASDIGRREVTLFGNGTVRLREGPPEEEQMSLGELEPEALEGVVARLEAVDLSEVRAETHGVEGEWVERCLLELPLREGGGGPASFRFSRYATLPLELSRVVDLAREVGAAAEGKLGPGLPAGYEPRRGDVLERTDGARFRVVQWTADGKGVELRGLEVPLTLYLPAGGLGEQFVALVSRERP
ncbi:MAG TPA: hypothetical protein VJG13_11600 [Thermoanaerobaculia bacterium]|nr:hypothetical protein [Thermoanaerobaculia bacterium]